MREAGGRAVERSLDIAIRPTADMIGIRPDFAGDEVPQGGTAKFCDHRVGRRRQAQGHPRRALEARQDRAELSVVPLRQLLELRAGDLHRGGRLRARSTSPPTARSRFRSRSTGAATASRSRRPIRPARPPATSSTPAGIVTASSTETPDGLEIALDKETYAPGEVAKLKITPLFAGELLVAVGADRLLTTISSTVSADGATVDIPVGADWGAGAYVTATLFRPGEAQESRMPARAIGVKWLKVDPGRAQADGRDFGARKIDAALDPVDPGLGDRSRARQRRLCHGRRRRRRHPQPDQIQGARPGSLVLRPASGSASNCATSTAA